MDLKYIKLKYDWSPSNQPNRYPKKPEELKPRNTIISKDALTDKKARGIHTVTEQPETGFKMIACDSELDETVPMIAEVSIPVGSTVVKSSATQLRTNSYTILKMTPIIESNYSKFKRCHSIHFPSFSYEEGKTYKIDDLNTDSRKGCESGLHFVKNEQDALNYMPLNHYYWTWGMGRNKKTQANSRISI